MAHRGILLLFAEIPYEKWCKQSFHNKEDFIYDSSKVLQGILFSREWTCIDNSNIRRQEQQINELLEEMPGRVLYGNLRRRFLTEQMMMHYNTITLLTGTIVRINPEEIEVDLRSSHVAGFIIGTQRWLTLISQADFSMVLDMW